MPDLPLSLFFFVPEPEPVPVPDLPLSLFFFVPEPEPVPVPDLPLSLFFFVPEPEPVCVPDLFPLNDLQDVNQDGAPVGSYGLKGPNLIDQVEGLGRNR